MLTVKPGSSLKNKTGSWRSYRPVVDKDKCIACRLCTKICPDGAINLKNYKKSLKADVNYDYCKGCGLCAKECPVKAIKMEKEK